MAWWMWFLLGIVLLTSEFLTPGAFVQLFFGLGGVALGIAGAAGLDLPLAGQLAVFLALSLISLALLRKPMQLRYQRDPAPAVDRLAGETAIAIDEIAVDGVGKAELRGSVWNARNVGPAAIARSQRCRVECVEGLTLHIRA